MTSSPMSSAPAVVVEPPRSRETASVIWTSVRGALCERGRRKFSRSLALTTIDNHPKRRDGEPVREIARSCNVSHSTISRLACR
jgi:hypothetical protein